MTTPLAPRASLPRAFRSLGALKAINVLAMAVSLAAATSVAFSSHVLPDGIRKGVGVAAFSTGVPTLVLGIVWAMLLRSRRTWGGARIGWLLSIPLAAMNAGFACGLVFAFDVTERHLERMLEGFVVGSTIGAFAWIPALVATLMFFGAPVARAQMLADKGLAGEERGERIIGIASSILAALAFTALHTWGTPESRFWNYAWAESAGMSLLTIVPVVGMVLGALGATLAHARMLRRRRFVADVERGEVPGFRVVDAQEGKALVRVTTFGSTYRVADFEEEVYALDEADDDHPAKARLIRR